MFKHLLFVSLFLINCVFAQNVGIGTTNPETKLKVEGALSMLVYAVVAEDDIKIPKDLSIVFIKSDGAFTLNNTIVTDAKEGQILTIYNADEQPVYFYGEMIGALNGAASFVYINGDWRLTAKNNAGWDLIGNTGTTASNTNPALNQKANNNFIGTTDTKDLVFATNGYERMRIKTAADGILGRVGIGTSAPAGKLSIIENEDDLVIPALKIEENNKGDAIEITESGDGSGLSISSTGSGFGIFSNLYGSASISNPVGYYLIDSRSNTSGGPPGSKIGLLLESGYNGDNIGLYVDATGGTSNTAGMFNANVGIGSFSKWDFPQTLLELKTFNINTSSTSPGMLNIIASETGGTAGLGGSLSFSGYRNSTSEFRVWGSVEGRKSNSSTVNSSGYLIFKTNNGALTEKMRIDSAGNVGIGMQKPLAKLDVIDYGDIPTAAIIPGTLNVRTLDSGGAADIGGSISLGGYRSTATDNEFRVYGTVEGKKTNSTTTNSSGYLMFKTSNAGDLSERMRIFHDGSVRINSLAGSGLRVVTAGADGSLGTSSIGILETDPTWSEIANIVGTSGIISRTGRVMTSSSFIIGSAITTATGPGTTIDNQYHNVVFVSSQTAMTGISIFATGTHLDGDIKIFGIPMTDLLTTTTAWYGINAGATSAGSATNTNATTADDQFHTAQCPDNRVATGIEIYASGALDGNMKLRCNALATGYVTTNNGTGVESLINTPFIDANNITHMSTCPAGTFVKSIRIYSSTRLDNQVQVFCTGIRKN